MTTPTPTPPPASTPPPTSTPPRSPRRVNGTAGRVVAISTAALGAAIVVAAVWSSAVPAVAGAMTRSEVQSASTAGITDVSIDVSAARFSVRFADVDEARLDVRDTNNGSWTFETDGDTLEVRSPEAMFIRFFGSGNGRAILTLPRELEGIDADVTLGAGRIDAEGDFGDLSLEMGGGDATVTGSADTLVASIGAGRGDFDLDDVRTAELELDAGRLSGSFGGTAPDEVGITVNAGALDLRLPDETYAVTSEVSAGGFDNDLEVDPASPRSIRVDLSAGSVSLQAD